eukprot:scaffold5513_cov141-Skeletonema_menzelii.AAC.3
MEFLAESIGLLDIYGSSSSVISGGPTPQNKPAHLSSTTKTSSFSSISSIDGQIRDGGRLKKSPQHVECDCCSKKTFNLALENLSDRESCCRCDCRCRDCQRNNDQLSIDYDHNFGDDEDNNDNFDNDADHANDTIIPHLSHRWKLSSFDEELNAIKSTISPSTPHNNNNNSTAGTQLTRLVTQRIDARTNYNCFTGTVDAVTGEIIHGTLVNRITGEVYEGPFVSGPRQSQNQALAPHDYNNNNNFECGSADTSETQFKTVSLRHGSNATSHFTNGMTFQGTYEFDRPKFGKWIMKDNDGIDEWMYEGPLIVVGMDDTSKSGGTTLTPLRGRQSPSPLSANLSPINSAPSSGNLTTASLSTNRVIGTSNPLPGSVLFHGNGTFVRYSDGMRYKGEFHHGLAHGVGKETILNFGGDGESVYQGEYMNGLRHGVGTLIEDVVIEDDDLGDSGDEGDEYCDQCCHRMLLAVEEEYDGTDNGPDFAAGGSNKQEEDVENSPNRPSQPISKPCSGCFGRKSSARPRRKQRYSSGVWCAGQFEVQDVVGIVRHSSDGRKEFVEDSTPSVMSAGTTWDLLPEKWLGLG